MLLKKKKKIVGCIPLALTNHTLAVGEQVLYLSSSLKCRWHWPPRTVWGLDDVFFLTFWEADIRMRLNMQRCFWKKCLWETVGWKPGKTKRAETARRQGWFSGKAEGGKWSDTRAVWGRLHTARGPRPSNCPCCRQSARWPVAPKRGESAWHAAGTLLQFALLSVLLESSLIFPWLQLVNFLKPYFPLLLFFFLILTEASITVPT